MQPCLFGPDFAQLQKAEQVSWLHNSVPSTPSTAAQISQHIFQGVVQALEVAANTVDELSKGSEANEALLERHCKSFLETVKVHLLHSQQDSGVCLREDQASLAVQGVQDLLARSAASSSSHKPYQGRAYSSQLQASLLAKQVELAEQQLLAQQQATRADLAAPQQEHTPHPSAAQ